MKGAAFVANCDAIYPLLFVIRVKYRVDVLETNANLH